MTISDLLEYAKEHELSLDTKIMVATRCQLTEEPQISEVAQRPDGVYIVIETDLD